MAINTKTYLSKVNTIVRDNAVNLSLNPVMELNYGKMLTRCLIYFDHNKVKGMYEDKTYPDITKLHHVLRMTNAASVNDKWINCPLPDSEHNALKQRAASFDLIYFLIPNAWDDGRGFDYTQDLYSGPHSSVSRDGCTWYQYRNYCKWDSDGVYSTDRLSNELDLFTSKAGNLSSIIIGYQHFEYGNEPIEFDITDTFNKFITGELCNYGIGIAFSPKYEETRMPMSQYVGFFTNHTNSFYEPYIETTYDDHISDDRGDFYLEKENKLFFYCNVGGKSVTLDEMPHCEIDGLEKEVKLCTKGAYYVEHMMTMDEAEPDTMHYDVWSNIIYKGKKMSDVELSFITKAPDGYFSFGLPETESSDEAKFEPYAYGIKKGERIRRGDVRKVMIDCKIPYTSNQQYGVDNIEYRLYTKQGERELDVIEYSPVERAYNSNYFLINTNDLIPSRYYIDFRIKYDSEMIYHRNSLEFDIINDVTEQFV